MLQHELQRPSAFFVMPGLVPGIHEGHQNLARFAWMAGTSPAMTGGGVSKVDPYEAVELERAADWRIRKLGENPDDAESAIAAKLLQKLADDVRGLTGSATYREYQAICGWLDEFDGMAELAEYAQDYRIRIGVDRFPAGGEEYLRVLIGFAKDTFGTP
jgi:hypothetical protein